MSSNMGNGRRRRRAITRAATVAWPLYLIPKADLRVTRHRELREKLNDRNNQHQRGCPQNRSSKPRCQNHIPHPACPAFR